ncbi:Glyoxylase, beta-lactamase superfamily II [Malonomonas rubra DSM 5091]|uniref:Glyoxylase, beta-lactamase superfamily II n=1 Tax=Malonomonas rubra DSM 5091 TaxID=1122189 RepID=A0A1M6MY74_MALRU|nr:MBL fold metallo-hydrolase [Malonomonas rubra]SHJ88293.1 Glyoxylase, beta-lactamase superfamily II [Malonomonas rubra DSM 5091]
MRRFGLFLLFIFCLNGPVWAQDTYRLAKVAEGVYAALAAPGGAASSNALIVDVGEQVFLCGAHFTRKAAHDLIAAATEVSDKPIRAFVLAHHHPGYSLIDFDIPANRDLVMNIETRLVTRQEERVLENPLIFFKNGMTFEGSELTLVLINVGPAHSDGDLIAYIPQRKILFTSDVLYFNSAGFLGAGSLSDWLSVLDGLETLGADKIIPGFGLIGTSVDLAHFKAYLGDFVATVRDHIEKGDSLETTLQNFRLPEYEQLPGYEEFTPGNVERAYLQLKEEISGE